jgi:lysophospholipase L1-like esterase
MLQRLLTMHNKPSALCNTPFKGFRSFNRLFPVLVASCIVVSAWNLFAQKSWVGTWSCAPYAVASGNTPPAIANNTLRQVVRVSIGGDTLRVKFSNSTCATAVTMNSVNIAVSPDGTKSAITASTMKQLKFSGNASVTIKADSTVTSDPIAFNLTPSMRVAITIYYGSAGNGVDMTGHVGSRTDSYLLTGDQTASAAFTGATVVSHWYHINTIDVLADTTRTHAVACFGNSITDGYGLSGGLQNRWTDWFSQALLNNAPTAQVGVLNLGIGGTNVAAGTTNSGASRYQQDILSQSGLKWIIFLYGINDICASNSSAATVTGAYQTMITAAHAKGIKVYGATITPVNGNTYYTAAHEAVRSAVNNWIRTPGNFDAFIDFDHTIRNPADTTRLQAAYENDWLHPNAAGYQLLGESIDLNLFTQPVKVVNRPAKTVSASSIRSWDDGDKVYSLNGKIVSVINASNKANGWRGMKKGNVYIVSLKSSGSTRLMVMP